MDDVAGTEPGAVPTWDEIVEQPLRPGLPARLPADRQPARRRGPHPGGLRAGLPLAVDLHPRHLRGLAAPHHHQPLPRPGPPQAADPLRRDDRRAGGPADQRAPRARTRRTPTSGSTTTSSARSRRCRRTSAPPWCCATSRGCPTRRSPRSSAPSSAPSGRGSTAGAPCCAGRWPTARPPPAGPATPGPLTGTAPTRPGAHRDDRSPRRPGQRAARRPADPGGGGAGLGARARLPPVPRPRRARGLGQDPAGRALLRHRAARRPRSRARCSRRCRPGCRPATSTSRPSRTPGRAGSRWSRSAAAPRVRP